MGFQVFAAVTLCLLSAILFRYYNGLLATDTVFAYSNLNETYDYIIVGAGSSGAIIASRLTEDSGVSVLLIEAGGLDTSNPAISVPGLAGAVINSENDWRFYTVPQKYSQYTRIEQRGSWPAGRVLGGTSSLNFMVYIRGSRHDYDNWAKEGCSGWSYKDVLPYFLKLEDIQIPSLYNSDYHARGGYVPISENKVTPLVNIYQKAAEEIGYKTVDYNGEDPIGFSYSQHNIKNGKRYSSSEAYLRPAYGRNNLHISVHTQATKVLLSENKAVGVEIIKDNRKLKIYAHKEVVISAGAVNSPAILLRSGIGPKEHLNALKIPVQADLPVGENLQDHFVYLLKLTLNQSYSIKPSDGGSFLNQLKYMTTKTGVLSGSVVEASISDQIPNRKKNEPQYPDYQIEFFSMAQDNDFIDGFPFNFNESVKYSQFTLHFTTSNRKL